MAYLTNASEGLEEYILDGLAEMAEINLGAPFRAIQAALDEMDISDELRKSLMFHIWAEVAEFRTDQHEWCKVHNIA